MKLWVKEPLLNKVENNVTSGEISHCEHVLSFYHNALISMCLSIIFNRESVLGKIAKHLAWKSGMKKVVSRCVGHTFQTLNLLFQVNELCLCQLHLITKHQFSLTYVRKWHFFWDISRKITSQQHNSFQINRS